MRITPEEQADFEVETSCCICREDLCGYDEKLKEEMIIIMRRLKQDKTIPVSFHGGGRYDFHLLVKNLGKVLGGIDVIAKNDEQHISITKRVKVGEGN